MPDTPSDDSNQNPTDGIPGTPETPQVSDEQVANALVANLRARSLSAEIKELNVSISSMHTQMKNDSGTWDEKQKQEFQEQVKEQANTLREKIREASTLAKNDDVIPEYQGRLSNASEEAYASMSALATESAALTQAQNLGNESVTPSPELEQQSPPSISISPEDAASQNDTNTLTSPDLGKLDPIAEEDAADLEAEIVEIQQPQIPAQQVQPQDVPSPIALDTQGIDDELVEIDSQAEKAKQPQQKTIDLTSLDLGEGLDAASITEGDFSQDDFDIEDDALGINDQNQFNELEIQTPSPKPREDTDDDEPDVVKVDANQNTNTDTDFEAAAAELRGIDIEPDTKEEHLSRNDEQIKVSAISTPSLELDDNEAPSLELDDKADEVDAEQEEQEDDAELTQDEKEEPDADEPDEEVDAELEGGPDITTAAKLAGNEIKKKLDEPEPQPQAKKQQPPKPTPGEGKKKEEKPEEEPQKKKQDPEKEGREHHDLTFGNLVKQLLSGIGNVTKAVKEDVQDIKDVGNSALEKGKNLLGIGGSKGDGGESPAQSIKASDTASPPAPGGQDEEKPESTWGDKLKSVGKAILLAPVFALTLAADLAFGGGNLGLTEALGKFVGNSGDSPKPSSSKPTAPQSTIEDGPAPDSSSLAPPLKQAEDNLVTQQASMAPEGPEPSTAMLSQKEASDAVSPTLKELAKKSASVVADVELGADNENDNKSRVKPGRP